jgi:hypothetical protein
MNRLRKPRFFHQPIIEASENRGPGAGGAVRGRIGDAAAAVVELVAFARPISPAADTGSAPIFPYGHEQTVVRAAARDDVRSARASPKRPRQPHPVADRPQTKFHPRIRPDLFVRRAQRRRFGAGIHAAGLFRPAQ